MSKRNLPGVEKRIVNYEKVEVRTSEDGTQRIVGHAALFNRRSEDLGGWREEIMPGAFRDAIGKSDVRSLFNHDPNFVLGRTKSGTLSIREDEHGLFTETDPPNTQIVRDMVLEPMARGDIDQMSFAFRLKDREESVEWIDDGETMIRRIKPGGVAELFDISPVTYAAYPDTSVGLRALDASVATESFHAIMEHNEALRERHLRAQHERAQWLRAKRLDEMQKPGKLKVATL